MEPAAALHFSLPASLLLLLLLLLLSLCALVSGLGSKPLIEIKAQEDGSIWLECISGGWYPEPLTVWRDPYGEVVPALKEVSIADADGLFMVTTAVIIRDKYVRNVSCSVN
ncbi:butyrophilin subfamily 2 member A2, partial [Homo sapiens]